MNEIHQIINLYWSIPKIEINILIFLNLLGSLLLGLCVGYERSYHGRAAGMRTYGLVCMASTGLIVILGYPNVWYGTGISGYTGDPTRVIQGIVTGIGFLGAGLIRMEGLTISGMTSAASIWSASAIGILVGLGFYGAAILLAVLSVFCMVIINKIEDILPSRPSILIHIRFEKNSNPNFDEWKEKAKQRGYVISENNLSTSVNDGILEWRFIAIAINNYQKENINQLTNEIMKINGISSCSLTPSKT